MIPYKLLGYLVGAAAVLGALFWVTHAIYAAGDKAGAERIQIAWDDDKRAIAEVTAKALAKATQERDDAIQANEAINEQHHVELQTIQANSLALAQRLRDAEARSAADRRAVSKAADIVRAVTTPQPSGMGSIDDAIAATLTECAANRSQLNALIAELKPQL